jgi:hypothetical protein
MDDLAIGRGENERDDVGGRRPDRMMSCACISYVATSSSRTGLPPLLGAQCSRAVCGTQYIASEMQQRVDRQKPECHLTAVCRNFLTGRNFEP